MYVPAVIADVSRAYLESKCVPMRWVPSMQRLLFDIVPPPAVVGGVGTEVQSAAHDVVAALFVGVVVAPGFHDIDLTGAWPFAVDAVGR